MESHNNKSKEMETKLKNLNDELNETTTLYLEQQDVRLQEINKEQQNKIVEMEMQKQVATTEMEAIKQELILVQKENHKMKTELHDLQEEAKQWQGKTKKQKEDHGTKRSLLFGECPDEVVLLILSFCPMKDIRNTRSWQTEIVRHSTETRTKLIAAEYDNLDNLKWIYGYIGDTEFYYGNGEYGEKTNCTELAAENGNLGMLKWLKTNGCQWGIRTFDKAAKNGSLVNMKWLLEHKCGGMDEYTFSAAAAAGNLENMIWLLDNACPWDEDTFSLAVEYGNTEVVNWLKEHGCPESGDRYFYRRKNIAL